MRIAIFHELPFGGARDSVYYFGRGLTDLGIDIDLYYSSDEKDEREESFFKYVHFYRFTPKKWRGKNWKSRIYKDTIELYKIDRLHKEIAEDIDDKNYDLVFIHGSQYIEAPFILKYLTSYKVFYCHDPYYRIVYEKLLLEEVKKMNFLNRLYENVNRKFRKHLDKQNFRKADFLIANSHFARTLISKVYGRGSEVVYPGVDVEFFAPQNKKKNLDIFFIGSYQKIDGYDLLEEALSKIAKNIVLQTRMFEDGWISSKQVIKDFYNRSKMVVCLAYNEPFGSVPLEAMSTGVPVIAVNEGGYKETVLDGKTGFLIKRDSDELAKKIKFLLNNTKKYKFMSKFGREYMTSKWTWDKSCKKLAILLKDTIKEI